MSDGKPAPQNIQDAFLNTVRREKSTVMILSRERREIDGAHPQF